MSKPNVIIQESNTLGVSSGQKIDNLEREVSKILEFDELDAHIYLNLLRIGPITASALAKELGIERTKAYRTIDKLLGLKIVSTTFSKPKLCIANSIEETIPTNYTSNLPTFNIAQGADKIYSDIEKLLENSKNVVYIVTTLKDLSKMYHTNIPEKIQECRKGGGEVRLLTEVPSDRFLPFVKKFGATKTRFGKLGSKGRMIVEKDKQMLMSDVIWRDSDQTDVETDYGVCTNSTEMVNNIFTLCDFLWNSFKPVKTINVRV